MPELPQFVPEEFRRSWTTWRTPPPNPPATPGPTPRRPRLTTIWHHPFWDATHHRWTDAHDLTVADLHSYYVLAGQTPVLVHNCGEGVDGIDDDTHEALDNAHGTQVADGVDYQVQRMHSADHPEASAQDIKNAGDHVIPGIGHNPAALGRYFASFKNATFTHVDPVVRAGSSAAEALYDADKGVAIIRNTRMIHGYAMSVEDFAARFAVK